MSKIICPICNEGIYHGVFEKHVSIIHKITSKEAYDISNNVYHSPVCRCGCNEKCEFISYTKGYANYKQGHGYKSRPSVWNKGKTKENDTRILLGSQKQSKSLKKSYSLGQAVIWNKGHTKSNDERVLLGSKRQAKSLKEAYASGKIIPWSKGKTKDDGLGSPLTKEIAIERVTLHCLDRHFVFDKEQVDNYDTFTSTIISVLCAECDHCITKTMYEITRTLWCPNCGFRNSISSIQQEICDYITSLDCNAIMSTRSIIAPKEIDIYIKEKKVAIELHGLYWHSDIFKDRRHIPETKRLICNTKGIRLLQFFSDEWITKKKIVESMLRHSLKCTSKRIYARKCELCDVNEKDAQAFFDINHLSGYTRSIENIGLLYDGELVMCISLRKPFHKKWNEYLEISRMCSLLNTNVIGGLSKLLAEIDRRNYTKIMTYVDLAIGTGESYMKCGFNQVGLTKHQQFWWTNSKRRFNRFKFRAKNGVCQNDVAKHAGVVKILGCKNLILERVK